MLGRPLVALCVALALIMPVGASLGPSLAAPLPEAPAPAMPLPPGLSLEGLPLNAVVPTLRGWLGGDPAAVPNTDPAAAHWMHKGHVASFRAWLEAGHARTGEALQVIGPGALPGPEGPGAAACLTGLQTIAADTLITGSVCYDGAELVFTVPDVGHRTMTVDETGSLAITNSTVRNADGDRLAYGLIEARGAFTLQNSQVSETVVFASHGDPAVLETSTQLIQDNTFTNNPYGVYTDRDLVTIQRNTFFKNDIGVFVDAPAGAPAWLSMSNPEVLQNTFEMNQVGIFITTDQESAGPEPTGRYEGNTIRANIQGITCYANGWTNPADENQRGRVLVKGNNIYTNWGDATHALRGITIPTPFGNVEVPDSECVYDGNHYGSDSRFTSQKDTTVNTAGSPLALPSTPPLPHPLVIIGTPVTWSAATPAPAITGPVVVVAGGQLTITQPVLSSAFTIGSAKGGRITVDGTTVSNANGIIVRNDLDSVRNAKFLGTQLFDPLTVYRNNATVRDSEFVGAGRDRNAGAGLAAGQFTEEFTWQPKLISNKFSNTRFGATAVTMTVTLNGNTFKNIGPADETHVLGSIQGAGIMGIIVTLDMDNNVFQGVTNALMGQVLAIDSNGDRFDGGFTALNTLALNTQLTFTNAVFSNLEFGLMNLILDANMAITNSNFTYNAYGLWALSTQPAVTASNFYNNYLQAIYPYTSTVSGVPAGATVTCNSCWLPSDESWLELYGSSVAMTQALGPNNVPKPLWAGQEKEVRTGTLTLTSGTLQGPVIARTGGKVVAERVDLDLDGRFSIGAKGAGRSGAGPTGKLLITDSRLSNGGFVAFNSTDAKLQNNVLQGFTGGAGAIQAHWNGGLVECNNVKGAKNSPGRVLDMLGGGVLDIRRNLFTKARDFEAGIGLSNDASGLGGDTFHFANVRFDENGVAKGVSPRGAIYLGQASHVVRSLQDNNFISNLQGTGALAFSRNWTASALNPAVSPVAIDATGSFWGDATGPSVIFKAAEQNPGGLGLALLVGPATTAWPPPAWQPFATAMNTAVPCVSFVYGPLKPLELETLVSFDASNTFAPSGAGIASYTWNFGDGTPALVTGSPTASHTFAAHGVYPVTLTAQTNGGQADSVTRNVKVFARPVASFSVSPGAPLETQTVTLTDTSTDPDGAGIASRAWSCSDGFAATGPSAAHKFADGGSYSCSLTVVDNDGFSSAPAAQPISVAHVGPVANFATAPAGGLSVQFTDTSTHPNAPVDAPPAGWTYNYDFGDSTSSTQRSPLHTFAAQGVYNIVFTACDNDGLCSAKNLALNLANELPTADIQAMPPSTVVGGTIQLDGSGSSDPDGSIVAWEWDLDNDGATDATGPTASVSFAAQGDYPVSLRVTDDQGGTASATKVLHVCEPPGSIGLSPLSIELCASFALPTL